MSKKNLFYNALLALCVFLLLSFIPSIAQKEVPTRPKTQKEIEELSKIIAPAIDIDLSGEATIRLLKEEEEADIKRYKEELRKRNEQIAKLEQQIKNQEGQLLETSGVRLTLQTEINRLNLENRKTRNNILLTQEKIRKANLTLDNLKNRIDIESENTILLRESLGDLMRFSNEISERNPFLALLAEQSVFEYLKQVTLLEQVNEATLKRITEIQNSIETLQKDKRKASIEEQHLLYLSSRLKDEQFLLQINTKEKSTLLQETKNKEDQYQTLLQQSKDKLTELLNEVADYESQISFILDPESIPKAKKGVLGWPLGINAPFTQFFGNTAFAKRNAHLYGRPFHDGLDFGIPTGTSIVSAEDGIVVAIGNTELVRSCRLWGKWILVAHNNGLSTLYAHLSLIKAVPGRRVKRGELIGYSGNTGNSTGPHLHFGLYVSDGIEVVPYESFSQKGYCNGLSLPLAAQSAKLDPLLYIAPFTNEQ